MVTLEDELEMIVSDQKRKAYKSEQENILKHLRQNLADQDEPKKEKKKKKKKKDTMMVTNKVIQRFISQLHIKKKITKQNKRYQIITETKSNQIVPNQTKPKPNHDVPLP